MARLFNDFIPPPPHQTVTFELNLCDAINNGSLQLDLLHQYPTCEAVIMAAKDEGASNTEMSLKLWNGLRH